MTQEAGLGAGNDRYHFAAAWADYDSDGWPDLLVANDFGTKNLYRNLGRRDGRMMFEDVAAAAGTLDHGAGMSATFLDYDNDGRLDIYTGNMWSAPGLRVTSAPTFMPDATPDVRALYRRHVRGNSLLRNGGNGRFEDRTVEARAAMGRWAWSSDALDFDSDGWDDLYVVNGMLTRKNEDDGGRDLEGFFWRQVVARSPLTRIPGTPYDGAWRAINELLIHGSIASRQRNVFLRNDGQGGFDEIAGTLGLDLDQDGRSFAVLDLDRDGDPDLAVMAARQAPQLRVFRNDYETRSAALVVRLTGTTSNRDAVGARVTVETDRLRKTRIVQAGSGFLSQHSKELTIGLGASERVVALKVDWPSGGTQVLTDVPLNSRVFDHRRRHRPERTARRALRWKGRDLQPAADRAAGRNLALRAFPGARFLITGRLRDDAIARSPEREAGGRSLVVPGGRGVPHRARSSGAGAAGARQGRRRIARHRGRDAGRAGLSPSHLARDRAGRRRHARCEPELRDPQPAPVHESAEPSPAHVSAPRRRRERRQDLP